MATISDPITVLHQGATQANVDVGFLFNRANGLISNVALYWNETSGSFSTAFTSNSGTTDTNISVISYAPVTTGNLLPGANIGYSLGSPTQRWKDLWLSGSTIYIGGASISSSDANTVSITNQNGGSFNVTGSVSGQATGTFGNVSAISGQPSTSTTTGALLVDGGAGITGNAYVGTLFTTSGIRWAGNGSIISTGGGGGGAGVTYTASTSAPFGPTVGDQWYYTTGDILYEYQNVGTGSFWVDITSPTITSGNVTVAGGDILSPFLLMGA